MMGDGQVVSFDTCRLILLYADFTVCEDICPHWRQIWMMVYSYTIITVM